MTEFYEEPRQGIRINKLIRIETFLSESGIDPLVYLTGFLKGVAPAPVVWNGAVYLDTGDIGAWQGQLRARAKIDQIKAMEAAHG